MASAAQIIKSGENVTILSRNKTDFMKRFERIADAARSIDAKDAMIDGEIVFLADDGRPRFEDLQNFSRRLEHRLFFFAFDLLHLNGKGLISRPIEERKEILRSLVPSDSAIPLADSVDAGPEALIDFAREHRLEGVEAKRRGSRYEPGKGSGTWAKFKTYQTAEFWLVDICRALKA